ncbi:hypothetical protein NWP09_11285, partial [Agrococcus sp. HG114]|nr:hypothetical protein [Agrococcus sp. HG114]
MLAWVGFGAGFAALTSVAVAEGSAVELAVGTAAAIAAAALVLLVTALLPAPMRASERGVRGLGLLAAALALVSLAGASAMLL